MRDKITRYLSKEIIGPNDSSSQEEREEIITENPTIKYISGVLYPQDNFIEEDEGLSEDQSFVDVASTDENSASNDSSASTVNAFRQSSIGVSVFMPATHGNYLVEIYYAIYKPQKVKVAYKKDGKDVKFERQGYARTDYLESVTIKKEDLSQSKYLGRFPVHENSEGGVELELEVRKREMPSFINESENGKLFTISLINQKSNSRSGNTPSYNDCFFQVTFKLISDIKTGFLAYPENLGFRKHNKDELRDLLLYRNINTLAIGHGCSPMWNEQQEVWTSFMPEHEIKPIIPAILDAIDFKMIDLSDVSNRDKINSILNELAKTYESWIVSHNIDILPEYLKNIGLENITECNEVLSRVIEGIEILYINKNALKAFQWMNRAMLDQQIKYSQPIRKWAWKDQKWSLESGDKIPVVNDVTTWPDWDPTAKKNLRLGSWRPFQLAFVLMNLKSIVDPSSDDRGLVDLIWFPTGGGKTEAYLGLSAFTIFYNRLSGEKHSGTEIIMRYTLRLLTAQQFQRAASLITACEMIRKETPESLGDESITIGLWVGQSLSPNKNSVAIKKFEDNKYPFVITRCPSCNCQFGPTGKGRNRQIFGLQKKNSELVFSCPNPLCETYGSELPIYVVDEQIYNNPPSLLLGTVDKFALIPWMPEIGTFFGVSDSKRMEPPSLIIQDELHLITGPLGSMVGHYEFLIHTLCANNIRRPKIIASTATISQAKAQMKSLYAVEESKVKIFPPPLFDAGETFFATVSQKEKGRKYVGVYAPSSPSFTTTQVRTFSATLQGSVELEGNIEEKDAYYTLVTYFNSLRELGHAVTLLDSDIPEDMRAIQLANEVPKEKRRYLHYFRRIELTSRKGSEEIPFLMEQLNVPIDDSNKAVEVCLATNMISVGLDIQRLGLMAVVGQPKSTSEYIQATSRVGRAKGRPGIILMLYNPNKPRDRSHFEQFISYHSKIYSKVEPMSVTPFSIRVRERALHALIIGLNRLHRSQKNRINPDEGFPTGIILAEIRSNLEKWIKIVAIEELEGTLAEFDRIIKVWDSWRPFNYGDFSNSSIRAPLMIMEGKEKESWTREPWSTPTSMRNVDKSCFINQTELDI